MRKLNIEKNLQNTLEVPDSPVSRPALMPPTRLDNRPALVIVGASTRAAAHSAIRAGWRPFCVDMYGDADLHSVAPVLTVADYPRGLPRAAETFPAAPWIYTGGLENHPDVVAEISDSRPLLGNGPDVLARVRDPWWVAARLQAAGLPALELRSGEDRSAPRDGNWLRKPLRGAGGRGICLWEAATDPAIEPTYFQRFVTGNSYSAQFLAAIGGTRLLGVTRQLVGLCDVHAPLFAWCGNITQPDLPPAIFRQMHAIGETLASAVPLRGLFGCDFVVADRTAWLTEVNPRYTAAMELLDYQLGASLLGMHLEACGPANRLWDSAARELPGSAVSIERVAGGAPRPAETQTWTPRPVAQRHVGRIVLFADRDLIAADATHLLRPPTDKRLPLIADLPRPGQEILRGAPVCSVFTNERTEKGCVARLVRSANRFRYQFLRPLN